MIRNAETLPTIDVVTYVVQLVILDVILVLLVSSG